MFGNIVCDCWDY